jgi:predicted GH43/DUF377 family glycosyl hydrolase
MKRFIHNPILEPIKSNDWESQAVFNAAAVYSNGLVHLVYRAIGADNVSRLGLATSNDGFTIKERFDVPVFNPVNHAKRDGCEDPRLTVIGNECLMAHSIPKPRFPVIYQISDKHKHERFC